MIGTAIANYQIVREMAAAAWASLCMTAPSESDAVSPPKTANGISPWSSKELVDKVPTTD